MIVVYGTICLDRIRRVPHLPSLGGYVEIEDEVVQLGGEAANTARFLRQLGSPVRLVGNSIGVGAEANLIRTLLGDAETPHRDHPAPYCDIYVTPDGERTMMGRGFAEMPERNGLECLELDDADWLTVDANHGEASVEALRRGEGVRRLAMDLVECAPMLTKKDIFQTGTDWTGTKGDLDASRKWLQDWTQHCAAISILTDGAQGLLIAAPNIAPIHLAPLEIAPVVDATGAGDSFRAGLLHALSSGTTLAEAVPFAMACGAVACTGLGAGGVDLSYESVQAVLESNQSRVSEASAKLQQVDWSW